MEQRNYLKLVWVAAFLAFAAVSCWATSESLHLLLPSWPKIMCWIVTVGFFIIASLGTKLIVDSLNQNIYYEKRGLKLILGIVLVLVFWLVCSMPTNTHTFFYRSAIYDKVNTDISVTRGYLNQIANNTNNETQATQKINELEGNIKIRLAELEGELKNEVNPGNGPKCKEILGTLAKELGVAEIKPLSYKGTSIHERDKLVIEYRKLVYQLFETKAQSIRNNILKPNSQELKEVKNIDKNLALVKQYIDEKDDKKKIDLNNAEQVSGIVCDKLNSGYVAIKRNKDFVNFQSESDKELYTSDNPVTKVKRMISVFDVWEDFLKGCYKGYGFAFWIIISILVDIAAFIFFDLAFRKTDE